MSLQYRSITSIDDLSDAEIEEVFSIADRISESPKDFSDKLDGRVLASLFYEPSTRTRLSFEAAISRLGGKAISAWDMHSTSVAKGETLADTVRVVASYADVVVLRHPLEGAAAFAAEYSGVPVINAGDGGHEHPTQTLCDLYTLRKKHKRLQGLSVALCGDLQNGRTVHSLAYGLARLGANVYFVPGNNKQIPDYVLHKLEREYKAEIKVQPMGMLSALFGKSSQNIGQLPEIHAVYVTPTSPNQLALTTEEGPALEIKDGPDKKWVIYVTRFQKERQQEEEGEMAYPRVTPTVMRRKAFKNVSVLHPLPRVDELSVEMDSDERSLYFQQAAFGLPIRMALLQLLLKSAPEYSPVSKYLRYDRPDKGRVLADKSGTECSNSRCITRKETPLEGRKFEIYGGEDGSVRLRCLFCDHELQPTSFSLKGDKHYYDISFFDWAYLELNLTFYTSDAQARRRKLTEQSSFPTHTGGGVVSIPPEVEGTLFTLK